MKQQEEQNNSISLPVFHPVLTLNSPPALGNPDGMRGYANKYRERGWVPIPVEPFGKRPTRKLWPQSTTGDPLDDFQPHSNLSINLGKSSGGLVDIDLDCNEAATAADYLLPETGLVFGPSSNPRTHRLYKVANCGPARKFVSPELGMLVEYRADGCSTVFPPSLYEGGEPRVFLSEGVPADVAVDDLQRCVARVASAALLAKLWRAGIRHELSLSLAGALANSQWNRVDIEKFVIAVCKAAGDEEIRDRMSVVNSTLDRFTHGESIVGLPTLAEHLGEHNARLMTDWLELRQSRPDRNDSQSVDMRYTDIANTDVFAQRCGDDIAFSDELGWLVWNQVQWDVDAKDRVIAKAEATARQIGTGVIDADSRWEAEELRKRARRTWNKSSVFNIVDLAASRLSIDIRKLDKDPWLLNCQNGTVNLRTGELQSHSRSDFITKLAPVTFNANAEAPRFEAFVSEVMGGNASLVAFLQRAIGYSLTGSTREQCLFILHGSGANGKSTLVNLFEYLLGDYSQNTPVQTLLEKRSDGGASSDLARLRGARFVTASEVEDGQRMAIALVKRLTGGDTVTARYLHKEFFEFTPSLKLWLPTNHKPKIPANDEAAWRRINLVPFVQFFGPERRDSNLPARLRSEASGILNWAIKGCMDWQRYGLSAPAEVQTATRCYREEMDVIGQFLSEITILNPRSRVSKEDLYQAYQQWAGPTGSEFLSKRAFGTRMKEAGKKEFRSGSKGHYWLGLQLIEEIVQVQQEPLVEPLAFHMDW